MSARVPKLTREHLFLSDAALIRNRWPGQTAVILGSGPSLSSSQIGATIFRWQQRQCVVFAVNSSWHRFPSADVCYSNDVDWFALNLPAMRGECRGEFWCGAPSHELPGVRRIPFDKDAPGMIASEPDAIAWAGNSGGAAISLAVLAGCRRILLTGFDQQGDHWHPPHPEAVRKPPNFPMWAQRFAVMAREADELGVEIVNCSEQTSLTCFRRGVVREELAQC